MQESWHLARSDAQYELTARSRVAFALELARCNLDVALFLVVPRCLAVVPCRRLPMSAF
jgi:hypothetical protein